MPNKVIGYTVTVYILRQFICLSVLGDPSQFLGAAIKIVSMSFAKR